jgi:hypothetical protein
MPDSGDSLGYDDLSVEQLHQLHHSAAREARGGDPLAIEMLAVIGALSRRRLGVPASLDDAPAAVVIMARAHARRLCAAVGDALCTVLSVSDRVRGHDPELALPGVSVIVAALCRARAHLADLGPDVPLGLDLDHCLSAAQRLTDVLARSASFNACEAWDLLDGLFASLRDARFALSDLVLSLGDMPADASGADLSGLDLHRLDALHGVTWTRATTWPPAIAEQVRVHSAEEEPGRLRIRIPYAHGPARPAP